MDLRCLRGYVIDHGGGGWWLRWLQAALRLMVPLQVGICRMARICKGRHNHGLRR
jgi:hypothetical protein